MSSKEMFTVEEAAAELGVSSSRVRQMALDGSLEAGRFGRALAFSREAVEKAKRRKTSPGPEPKSKAAAKPARKTARKTA